MGKSAHDDVLDQTLDYIKTKATRISVCNAQPTTFTQAITTYMLVIKTISSSDFTGPANGDASGRKLTSNQHAGITITNSGTATHVALCDYSDSKLLLVTTCSSLAITQGNLLTIAAWDIELSDPA